MTDDDRRERVLQMLLFFAGLGWGLSFLFFFWEWESAVVALKMMGCRNLDYDPFLHYWMRLIGAIFGFFGLFCFVIVFRPKAYRLIIPWIGWVHLVCVVVAGGSALDLKMEIAGYPTLLAELAFFGAIGITLIWLTSGSSRGIPSGSCASPK